MRRYRTTHSGRKAAMLQNSPMEPSRTVERANIPARLRRKTAQGPKPRLRRTTVSPVPLAILLVIDASTHTENFVRQSKYSYHLDFSSRILGIFQERPPRHGLEAAPHMGPGRLELPTSPGYR
jgi:hypothetical protein